MKVGKLIADSIWLPNARADRSATPALSILMPTYCRGRDGLFRRAVRSVLDQELQDFELIIVDDGSVDGTQDEIHRVMADDPRVHCVRHPRNIGLPAVSMFEAYQHARADYIGFAFDDDVATRDGFARLVEYAVEHASFCVHGQALYGNTTDDGGESSQLVAIGRRNAAGHYPIPSGWVPPPGFEGNEARCLWKLQCLNLIGNMSVLLHRQVIETVGFYDPHVIMVRSCDWDLWKRVAARFPIDYCDVETSIENGDQRSDALGRIYSMDFQRVVEYSQLPRDHRLVPSRLPEFDVWEIPDGADARLAAYAERARRQMRRRGTLRWIDAAPDADRTIVLLYDRGPATHLLLHALPIELRRQFSIHHGSTEWDALWPVLINASAVIVCGDAERFARLSIGAEIRDLEIPFYFYAADRQTPANLTDLLPNLQGIVATTKAGLKELPALGLADAAIHWPLAADADALKDARLSAPALDRAIVGVVGGRDDVASALASLAEIERRGRLRLRVYARYDAIAAPSEPGRAVPTGDLETIPVPEDCGWSQLVAKWRRYGIHLLLITSGASAETAFDGEAAVLLASLIGAMPIVLDARTSSAMRGPAVIRIANVAVDFERVAIDLHDANRRAVAYARAVEHCRTNLAAENAARAARQLLDRTTPVDVLLAEERWRRLERLRTRTIVAQHEQIQQWQARCKDLERTSSFVDRLFGGAPPIR